MNQNELLIKHEHEYYELKRKINNSWGLMSSKIANRISLLWIITLIVWWFKA